jgi:molybdate transport system substrate-binding protein
MAAALLAAAILGVLSCGDDGADTPLTVFAAASLTDVLEAIDPDARYNFAGSDQLAFQIEQGAPADVFAAASVRYPQNLFDEGLVSRPVTFATNTIVVIVPIANPAGIDDVADLTRPGLRLLLGDVGVPVGDYARAALQRLGLRQALDNVVSNEDDARAVVAKVALGEADAGLVYATDARSAARRVQTIRVPARGQPPVEYQAAVVTTSPRRAAAERFVERLLSNDGQRRLASSGFGPPR